MRLTFGDIKSDIAEVAGYCVTDARVPALVNEAQERLMTRGKWVGTYQRYRIFVNENVLTWPRQIETIEAFSVSRTPGTIRNQWFEFNENGTGPVKDDDYLSSNLLVDRGEACGFDDITPGATDRKIKVYADTLEDASARITLQGYDENGNWIRTQLGDLSWIDGEQVAMTTGGTLSAKKYTSLTAVLKPVTLGNIRLYELETTGGTTVRALAIYEPDETRPLYRRSVIPGLTKMAGTDEVDSPNKYVNVMAKLRHIPVSADNDWLLLRSRAAFRLGAQAILKEKKDLLMEGEAYWQKAITELERELASYEGDGAVAAPRLQGMEVYGAGSVYNIV